MTFDQLYKSIMEQGPGLTIPTTPKLNLTAPGGNPSINAPSTPVASTQQQQSSASKTGQPQTNQANLDPAILKKIKDLQSTVDTLTKVIGQTQGITIPKQPKVTSDVINPSYNV
jgi:hypothetical protein